MAHNRGITGFTLMEAQPPAEPQGQRRFQGFDSQSPQAFFMAFPLEQYPCTTAAVRQFFGVPKNVNKQKI